MQKIDRYFENLIPIIAAVSQIIIIYVLNTRIILLDQNYFKNFCLLLLLSFLCI